MAVGTSWNFLLLATLRQHLAMEPIDADALKRGTTTSDHQSPPGAAGTAT
jgi:hypothetical protein